MKNMYKTKTHVEERRERYDGIEETSRAVFREIITADSYSDAVKQIEAGTKKSGWTITSIKIKRV